MKKLSPIIEARSRLRRIRALLRGCILGITLGLTASVSVAAPVAAAPAPQAPTQTDVEAAYLFNFARFMHAPPHAADAFTIGVLGKISALPSSLQTLTAREQIGGKPLRITRVQTPEDAQQCDIMFFGETDGVHFKRVLDAATASNVLTVSDSPDFLARGGMIQFVMVGSRVRFSVNLDAVHRSKIHLSSELLKVALSVQGAGPATEVR